MCVCVDVWRHTHTNTVNLKKNWYLGIAWTYRLVNWRLVKLTFCLEFARFFFNYFLSWNSLFQAFLKLISSELNHLRPSPPFTCSFKFWNVGLFKLMCRGALSAYYFFTPCACNAHGGWKRAPVSFKLESWAVNHHRLCWELTDWTQAPVTAADAFNNRTTGSRTFQL